MSVDHNIIFNRYPSILYCISLWPGKSDKLRTHYVTRMCRDTKQYSVGNVGIYYVCFQNALISF